MTIEYTKERKAFGKAILDNQVVHFRLAELQTEIEALRSMLYRAVCTRFDRGFSCCFATTTYSTQVARPGRDFAREHDQVERRSLS
jgi:citronellyl-CoA dehydrogenase